MNFPIKPKILPVPFKGSAFELFSALENSCENCFFFESLGPNKDQLSRYTILGVLPDSLISSKSGGLVIDGKKYPGGNPYETLRSLIPQNILCNEFCGGLVGFISYDAVNLFEPQLKLKANPDFDTFRFGLYTDGIIYDHITGETKYFYLLKNRLPQILRLAGKIKRQKPVSVTAFGSSLSKKQHARQVEKVLREVKDGNVFQCEVGLKNYYKISGSLLSLYRRLREVNPSPYLYYIKFGDQKLIGSSPELLLSVNSGQMETFPLAGTIARGKNQKQDQALAKKLLSDPKEQAEHKMLVDLHRNDLGRVAKFGSVIIKKFMDIKKFSHVQHISSQIHGTLKPSEDMFSALKSCFPAGTLTGAPKIEAMKIINNNETEGRGPYGGAVGFFGLNGNCEFTIPIRSLFVNKNKAYTQASGGIVYDSKAGKEYQEIENKLKALDIVLKESMT
jgi:anthranilate synthase component 1